MDKIIEEQLRKLFKTRCKVRFTLEDCNIVVEKVKGTTDEYDIGIINETGFTATNYFYESSDNLQDFIDEIKYCVRYKQEVSKKGK